MIEERNYFRQILIRSGLTKLFWTNLHFIVLHFVAPAVSAYSGFREDEPIQVSTNISTSKPERTLISPDELLKNLESKKYSWQNIEAFWYPLS